MTSDANVMRPVRTMGRAITHTHLHKSSSHTAHGQALRSLSALAALTLISSSANAFSFDDLRRGVTEQEAKSIEEAKGHRVLFFEASREFMVHRVSDNKLVAKFAVCKGRLYEYVTDAAGGAVGFVKRVAQFSEHYGNGEVSAESKMLSGGEYNMIRVVWRRIDEVLTVTFFPPSATTAESQWISYSMPGICEA